MGSRLCRGRRAECPPAGPGAGHPPGCRAQVVPDDLHKGAAPHRPVQIFFDWLTEPSLQMNLPF